MEEKEINSEGEIIKTKKEEEKFLGKIFQKKKTEEPTKEKTVVEETKKPEVSFEEIVSLVYQKLSYEQIVSLANQKYLEAVQENVLLSNKLKSIVLNIS
jgi:hypothetical protein